jgi:DNA-binding response OmpR family regulator/DNA-binding HxlR family transcriptional regulator
MSQIQASTEIFSYKWYPSIIHTVYELEGAGYSELENSLGGISSKMLSDGLSDLCERNVLTTTETVEASGRTIYVLSSKGRALIPALEVLEAWDQHYGEEAATVLILEDERMIADIFADYFSESYHTQYVPTGTEALEAYTADTNLVIIDRKLDGMSGDTVADRIRAEHEQQLLLCVSGVEPDNDIYELDYDDYIHKPVEEDEMRTRMELLLNRAALDSTARTYLSLRSKQLALIDTYGKAATKMNGFENCTAKIEELDLSTDHKQTLEPLLPSKD